MSSPDDQLTLDDLLGFEAPKKDPQQELKEKSLKESSKILNSWANKSGRTKSAINEAKEIFSEFIMNGTSLENLRYIISNSKPMLKDYKKITREIAQKAIDNVDEDKKNKAVSYRIFDQWYQKYYAERYTQSPGAIMSCIKKAIALGISEEDVTFAMNLMGKKRQVVTDNSLQFALTQIDKIKQNELNAGSHAGSLDAQSEYEIFASRKLSLHNDEETYSSGGFYKFNLEDEDE